MTHSDIQIVEVYSKLFEGLSYQIKIELMERLLKSLKKDEQPKDELFYSSFRAFSTEKWAQEIIEILNQAENLEIKKLNFDAIYSGY